MTNPINEMRVSLTTNADGKYFIEVPEYCNCGHACCSNPITGWRPHTNTGMVFDDEDEAYEALEALAEKWEEDYDDYLEENSYAIRKSELYEMWKNEY